LEDSLWNKRRRGGRKVKWDRLTSSSDNYYICLTAFFQDKWRVAENGAEGCRVAM